MAPPPPLPPTGLGLQQQMWQRAEPDPPHLDAEVPSAAFSWLWQQRAVVQVQHLGSTLAAAGVPLEAQTCQICSNSGVNRMPLIARGQDGLAGHIACDPQHIREVIKLFMAEGAEGPRWVQRWPGVGGLHHLRLDWQAAGPSVVDTAEVEKPSTMQEPSLVLGAPGSPVGLSAESTTELSTISPSGSAGDAEEVDTPPVELHTEPITSASVSAALEAAAKEAADGWRRQMAEGWEAFADPNSGESWYYHAATGEASWKFPERLGVVTVDAGPAS